MREVPRINLTTSTNDFGENENIVQIQLKYCFAISGATIIPVYRLALCKCVPLRVHVYAHMYVSITYVCFNVSVCVCYLSVSERHLDVI